MPFTFSHPAATIPLTHFFKSPLSRLALVVGSMSPDFGYYAHWFAGATWAHTLQGSLALCIPSGLLLIGILLFFRHALLFLMPSRQREMLAPFLCCPKLLTVRFVADLCLAIWAGALTHLFWDSFTHRSGWFVQRLPLLQSHVTVSLPGYYLLQQFSTVAGAVMVIIVYRRMLGTHPVNPATRIADRDRKVFWTTLVLISAAIAGVFHLRTFPDFLSLWSIRVFLFRTAVASGAIFAALGFVSLLIAHVHLVRPRKA